MFESTESGRGDFTGRISVSDGEEGRLVSVAGYMGISQQESDRCDLRGLRTVACAPPLEDRKVVIFWRHWRWRYGNSIHYEASLRPGPGRTVGGIPNLGGHRPLPQRRDR